MKIRPAQYLSVVIQSYKSAFGRIEHIGVHEAELYQLNYRINGKKQDSGQSRSGHDVWPYFGGKFLVLHTNIPSLVLNTSFPCTTLTPLSLS